MRFAPPNIFAHLFFFQLFVYDFASVAVSLIRRYSGAIYQFLCSVALDLESLTDEGLMTRYVEGCNDSFQQLFLRYAPKLIRAARRRGLTESEAHDAVQQTFIHMHQGRFEFNQGMKLAPWIFTIAFNVMRDQGRRISKQLRIADALNTEPPEPFADSASSAVASSEEMDGMAEDIAAALSQLSDEQREVILLHFYEEMSFADIARQQGCKPGAVRAKAHRGYERLRQILPLRKREHGHE